MDGHFLAAEERQSKAGRVIERLVLCFFALVDLLLVFQFLTAGFDGGTPFQLALTAGFVAMVALGCWLIMRTKASPARVLWAVLLVSLAVRFAFVALIPTEPVSDFKAMYQAAQWAAEGDFSWAHVGEGYDYFYRWGYQIPFVLYQAVILRLFRSLLALKLFNVLFMVGANCLLYRIGRLWLSEKTALCVALIYALFPDVLVYTTVLTNQHIALFFLLLGVLLVLRGERWWEFALAGLCLAVSDLMRPEAVVIVAAIFCCGALRCIQGPNVGALKRAALSLALVLACYWLTKTLTGVLLVWTDIAPYGIQNRVPEWKFVVGLGNVEGYGTYSEAHADIFDMDSAGRRAVVAQLAADLFHRPFGEILDFFVGKLARFWVEKQYLSWTLAGAEPGLLILPGLGVHLSALLHLQWCGAGMQLAAYLLALPAPVLLWKGGKGRGGELLCIAVVCVAVCAYLLIEIQCRYRLFADPFWLLIGGVTLERLAQLKISLPWRSCAGQ